MSARNFTAHSIKIKYGRRRYANITIGGIHKTIHGYSVRVMGFVMKPDGSSSFTIKSIIVDRWPTSDMKFELSVKEILPENNKESISIMENGATSVGKTDDGCEIYMTSDQYPMTVESSHFDGGMISNTSQSVH